MASARGGDWIPAAVQSESAHPDLSRLGMDCSWFLCHLEVFWKGQEIHPAPQAVIPMNTTTISRQQQRPELHAASAGERVFGLLLEHGPLAPSSARHEARPILAAWGLDDDQIYDTLLVISELVTNAVSHALPPVVLYLCASTEGFGPVEVHVSDGGPEAAPGNWAAARPADEHGRGDMIVSALASQAGAGRECEGLIDHWASLDAA